MRFNCKEQGAESWQIRAKTAVDMLEKGKIEGSTQSIDSIIRVADFGCGNERLRHLLAENSKLRIEYQGYDLYPQIETTKKIDFELEIPHREFDVVFSLGLLEYLLPLPSFLIKLRDITKYAIVSYVVSDSGKYSPKKVLERGWKHHYSKDAMEDIFLRSGFNPVEDKRILNNTTQVWMLH